MKGKLEQGKYYDFKVIKLVSLDEGGQFWVLEDPFGFRQLLNSEYYDLYNITPGITLNCKVDKINCTGKIYLEPQNPFYKEGETYDFNVIYASPLHNRFQVVVKDEFGDEHTVSTLRNPGKTALCRVDRIKKGVIYLADSYDDNIVWFSEGEQYPFFVSDIRETPDCGECFFLTDDNHRSYILPSEKYLNHNISKGDNIICTVIKQTESGFCVLEPLHPLYKNGESHQFEALRLIKQESFNKKTEWVLWVKDGFDVEISVPLNGEDPKDFENATYVICEIERIKKGRPYLIDPRPVNTH